MLKSLGVGTGVLVVATLAFSGSASADILYYTNFTARQIYSLDTVTRATTLLDTLPANVIGNPDSLVFDPQGRVLYTVYNGAPGQVRRFDPAIGSASDTLIASDAFSSQLVDLTLEPSGDSVLVSDRGNNALKRVTLATGTVTTVGTFSDLNGLTYDASGNLFVVTNGRVDRVNPTTGAILTMGGSIGGFLDGLTFDSVTNKLWAATGSCIYNFDLPTLTPSGCITTPGFGGNDGIESDNAGHLFIAASGPALVTQYTISTGTFVAVSNNLGGLDDIAPVAGLGAPPTAPEPASFALTAIGVGLAGFIRRKTAR